MSVFQNQFSKLYDFTQQCSDLIVVFENGRLDYLNPVALNSFGITKDEDLDSFSIKDLVTSDSQHPVETFSDLSVLLQSEGQITLQYRNVKTLRDFHAVTSGQKLDSDQDWLLLFIKPLSDQSNLINMDPNRKTFPRDDRIPFADFTEEVSQIGGWELDVATGKVRWTKGVYQIYGLPLETPVDAIQGISYYAPQDQARITRYVERCISAGEDYDDTFEFIDAHGNHKWVRAIGQALRNSEGAIYKMVGTFQDITKTMSMEKEVQLHNFNNAQKMAKVGSWEFDIENQKISWSAQMFDIFPEDPAHGEPSFEKHRSTIHPDDRQLWESTVKRAIQDGEPYQMVFRTHHSEDEDQVVYVEAIGESIKSHSGQVIKIKGTCQDVTERELSLIANQLLQEQLQETKHNLDLALEGAGLGIWDWQLTDNSVKFDNRWAEMLGLDVNKIEMKLETWESRVHPDDIEQCYADIKAYMDGQAEFYENIHRMKHADGHWVYILDRGRFSDWDDDGKPTRFTGTHLNITEAKEREKELELIIQNSQMGIWKFDPIKNELIWDQSMYELYETDPSHFEGAYQAWVKTLHPECHEQAQVEFANALEKGKEFDTTFKVLTPNGRVKHIGARAIIERDSSGQPVYVTGVNWNRTKEQEAVDKLNEQMKMAQHQAKLASIGELAAGVGHEINNPLAVIKGYISSIKNKSQSPSAINQEKITDYLNKIDIATDRIAKIVQGLRTFSRSDTTDLSRFSPFAAIEETHNMLAEIYDKEGIQLKLDQPINCDKFAVYGNRGKFQQILINLISNARDATENLSDRTIVVSSSVDQEKLKLSVIDNGEGIDPAIQEKIFDPFFTTKDVNKGTGIGLSLVHNFTRDMGGQLEISETSHRGTTFTLTFPIEKVRQPMNTPTEPNFDTEGSTSFDGKVLIVDDEEGIRDYLAEFLEERGLTVTKASDGSQALALYLQAPDFFDLIISDMKMPELDGPGLLKEIRSCKDLNQPKFIFITGGINIDFEDRQNDLNGLFDGYLFKPFTQDKIFETLASCLKVKNIKTA